MKTKEARELGERIAALVQARQIAAAYALLSPVLAQRTPFNMLRLTGDAVGPGPLEPVNEFLERIAAEKTIGGWVVIASVLEQQLERDLAGAFDRCQDFIIAGNVWHAADTLGEGVVGQALVAQFEPALELLKPWREHPSPWVRRAVGTAVHHWAKRSRGAPEHAARAETLLNLLDPMFEEWEMAAVKGIGWGLKTLGRLYPGMIAGWLPQQVGRRHRAIMLRKALTYLSEEQRARVTGKQQPR